MFSSRSAAQT
ncbi:hypothetical protein EC880221_2294, partial [Escherichia coli 88.0221]